VAEFDTFSRHNRTPAETSSIRLSTPKAISDRLRAATPAPIATAASINIHPAVNPFQPESSSDQIQSDRVGKDSHRNASLKVREIGLEKILGVTRNGTVVQSSAVHNML
jgi:hypothetical protein